MFAKLKNLTKLRLIILYTVLFFEMNKTEMTAINTIARIKLDNMQKDTTIRKVLLKKVIQ